MPFSSLLPATPPLAIKGHAHPWLVAMPTAHWEVGVLIPLGTETWALIVLKSQVDELMTKAATGGAPRGAFWPAADTGSPFGALRAVPAEVKGGEPSVRKSPQGCVCNRGVCVCVCAHP